MTTLPFTSENIYNYTDIPNYYPIIWGTSNSNFVIKNTLIPIVNNLLANDQNNYVIWDYLQPNLTTIDNTTIQSAALGYELKIINGTFTKDQVDSWALTNLGNEIGTVIYKTTVNIHSSTPYISLSSPSSGMINIPSGNLNSGQDYTAILRTLVFFNSQPTYTVLNQNFETIGTSYFYYTEYSVINFTVNDIPIIANPIVNGLLNPLNIVSTSPITFNFDIIDSDGPELSYKIDLGYLSLGVFTPFQWNSGWRSVDQKGIDVTNISVLYTGPTLIAGAIYYWRISVQDGLSSIVLNNGTQYYFKYNLKPVLTSIQVNSKELIYGTAQYVPNTGLSLSWDFENQNPQYGYNIVIGQGNNDILSTGDVISSSNSISIPSLPSNQKINISIKARDQYEYSIIYNVSFFTNPTPVVQNFLIDNKINPMDIATGSPTFSWTFLSSNPLSVQTSFRIEVGVSDAFSGGDLWDTGWVISSSSSVVYGSTGYPVTGPNPIVHAHLYYVRVAISDGISTSNYANAVFVKNTAPYNPTLVTPTSGVYSGIINVTWLGNFVGGYADPDIDAVTYSLQITKTNSLNVGWTYLTGPLFDTINSYQLDTSTIKSGTDYGIRVIANDGFADSDPSVGGTSVSFTIANHVPNTPTIISPTLNEIFNNFIKLEIDLPDIIDADNNYVTYLVEITYDYIASPTLWTFTDFTLNINNTKSFIDCSDLPDGNNYKIRITPLDEKGTYGTSVISNKFQVSSNPLCLDFERYNGDLFISADNGVLYNAKETFWQVQLGNN